MNVAFYDFLTWFTAHIPSLLMEEPFIYFVAIALLCFIVKVFLLILGRRFMRND